MSLKTNVSLNAAAIVCEHVATQCCSILSAFRTEPDAPEDSGWQFFCGKVEEEDPRLAKVWLLKEVLELEPSLLEYLDMPPGIQIWRSSPKEDWLTRKF